MEALATIGLVSNVLGFIESITKLYALTKEYSSMAGAPTEVIAVSKRLELVIPMLRELDESGRTRLDHEKLALKIGCNEAEKLRVFLESLKISGQTAVVHTIPDPLTTTIGAIPASASRLKWLRSKRASTRSSMEKGWKAFKALCGQEKLNSFQMSLDRILDLIMMQQLSRLEATTLREETRTTILVQNSESIIRGLSDIRMSSNQPPFDLSSMQTKTVFMVPSARNPGFLGRDEILLQLDENLGSPCLRTRPTSVQIAALCGLGGIGKSQIALEYAYRQRDRTPHWSIFWILTSTPTNFEESYERIAAEFQLPGRIDPQADVLQLVRNWFESQYQRPWLIIIDNVDDTQIFDKGQSGKSPLDYLPKVAEGSILYTSRNRDVALDLVNEPITILPLSLDAGRKLLEERTTKPSTDAEKDTLLAELDHLPLAITQAASYMTKRNKTVSQYLTLFRDSEKSKAKLLDHKFVDIGREAKSLESVATTWSVSFQYIKSENPQAANLLFLMSFMDRQSIPATLLKAENDNPVDFENAVGLLDAYSFVSIDNSGSSYSMHRLVQTVTRAWLTDYDGGLSIQSKALKSLSSNFPDGKFETWETCARYLPHAESILSRILGSQEAIDSLDRSKLLGHVAWYFQEQGKYDIAQNNLENSLEIYNRLGISGSPEGLETKRKLAIVTNLQGYQEEAIKLFQEVLVSQESLLGPNHLETLDTVDKLALALANSWHLKRWVDSEKLARRSLYGRQLVLAEDDMKITESLRTLGWTLYREGKFTEAEKFLRDCLQRCNMGLGDRHPETNYAANDLALVLVNLGPQKQQEAESMLRGSANLTELLCGKDHPSSIATYINLCTVLKKRGKHGEAEPVQRDQLALCERVLGPNHPTTIWCIAFLGELLFCQEKYLIAESFIQKELEKRTDVARHDIAATLRLVDILGHVCEKLQKFELAEDHFGSVLKGRRKQLGEADPETLYAEQCLARVMLSQGRSIEAEKILEGLLPKQVRVLGEGHQNTILSSNLYGLTMLALRKFPEAEIWWLKILMATEQTLGPEHESTLIARDYLESALIEQRKWADWEKSCRMSLEIRQRLAPYHFDTLRVTSNLWFGLDQQGKLESERIFNDLLDGIKTLPQDFMKHGSFKNVSSEEEWYFWHLRNGCFDIEALQARGRMATQCRADGNYEDAEDIYREVSKNMEKTLGTHCEATKQLNEEFATFLDHRGKLQEAERLRQRIKESPF